MSKTRPEEPIGVTHNHGELLYAGLTKREYFAAQAMKGLLTEGDRYARETDGDLASRSVDLAEALIRQLNIDRDND